MAIKWYDMREANAVKIVALEQDNDIGARSVFDILILDLPADQKKRKQFVLKQIGKLLERETCAINIEWEFPKEGIHHEQSSS